MQDTFGHYRDLMGLVDRVLERESFDHTPLVNIRALAAPLRLLENGQIAWQQILRLHFNMQNLLREVVQQGPTFELDPWAEEELQGALQRHEGLGRDLCALRGHQDRKRRR